MMSVQDNKEEFDFDLDVATATSGGVSGAGNDSGNGEGLNAGSDNFDLDIPVDEPQADAPKKKSGAGKVLLIVGGVLLLIMVLLLGLVAVKVAMRTEPPTPQQTNSATGFDTGAGFTGEGVPATQLQDTDQVPAFEDESSLESIDWGDSVQPTVDEQMADQGQPYQPQDASSNVPDDGMITITDGISPQLTLEEQEFDRVLAQTASYENLPAGVVIDESVIRNNVQKRRFEQMESDISETRKTISEVSTALQSITGTVSELSTAIQAGSESQAQLAKTVDELSAKVEAAANNDEVVAKLQQDIQRIEQSVKSAVEQSRTAQDASSRAITLQTAQAQQARQRAAAQPAAPAPAPAPAPTAQPVAAAKPATPAPVQAAPRAVAAAPAPTPVADHCAGKPTSQVWRLKGVNAENAYVTRPSDRTGLIVRVGIEVPGFGRVLSLNPSNRTLCTTSGTIGR